MRISRSAIRILMLLSVFTFCSPAFSESTSGTANTGTRGLAEQIAGTYISVEPTSGGATSSSPTWILNLFADGNLTNMVSFQFSNGAPLNSAFSNQHGTWISGGANKVVATVLDLSYNQRTGNFIGTTVSQFVLQFDNTFQTITGTVNGKTYAPGVDPLNPGQSQPLNVFSDNFQAKRVTVSTSGTSPGGTTMTP